MATEKQIRANRANALRSTGPRTEEGKRKVRMNSIKHSFAGLTVVVPEHEAEAYSNHFKRFRDEYKPVGPTEEFLCQSLADLSYSTQQMRSQSTTMQTLAGNQSHESHETATPEINAVASQARHVDLYARRNDLLGTYEARKMRLFEKTRNQLIQIQKERKAQQEEELAEAIILRVSSLSKKIAWHPSENGFVYSLAEIDKKIEFRRRYHRLLEGTPMAA